MSASSLPVLVNSAGGGAAKAGADLPEALVRAFAGAGVAAQVQMLDGAAMAAAIAEAAKVHKRIVVAGGDGTMSGAAQILAGTTTELALLPLGTLNHLARDMGVPADLDAAAMLAVHGRAQAIDLGSVNGRHFVNNASIGLYPFMVKRRDAVRRHRGWPKWLAMLPAAWDAMARFPALRMRVDLGAGLRALRTPLLFIGNNRYAVEGAAMGTRDTVQAGQLWGVAVGRRSRLGTVWGAVLALAGRGAQADDFTVLGDFVAAEVTMNQPMITVAVDGEVTRLPLPLRFAILPGALRVVCPGPADAT